MRILQNCLFCANNFLLVCFLAQILEACGILGFPIYLVGTKMLTLNFHLQYEMAPRFQGPCYCVDHVRFPNKFSAVEAGS